MQLIHRKTLLYKSEVEYADYCINHVEGCSHGCKYPCYAYLLKKRCGIVKTYADWCQPILVDNALTLLDKEIPKYKSRIKSVHLCFSTDPFMYEQNQVTDLSLQIIDRLNHDHIKCTVLTKGIYPKELGSRNGLSKQNEYGITLVSLDESFRQEYEPHTARFKDRIKALKHLHDQGFKTWVSMEPYPTPNLINQDILRILNTVSFVDKIIFGRMNYSTAASQFKLHKEFYTSMAKTVITFCKSNKIAYHIKAGTLT